MTVTNPLLLFGLILLAAVLLGAITERAGIPWITGCIVAGIALGPDGFGLLSRTEQVDFGPFLQASLGVIAFNIGSHLTLSRLRAIGGSVAWLTIMQLIAPALAVFGVIVLAGYAWPTALVVAAVAPATAPTTTYAIIRRRKASGTFVDRALAILAINDAATMLLFSVVSAATIAWLGAPGAGQDTTSALLRACRNEGLSLLAGAVLGVIYLLVQPLIADGRPGAKERLRALVYALLLVTVGLALAFGLSPLLTPLALGAVTANGARGRQATDTEDAIAQVEEPLYMVFFVLAGAHLPLADLAKGMLALAGLAYVLARLGGKYLGVFLGASMLGLDSATRRWLGLCFPSQGGAAMGLVLAAAGSPALHTLPSAAAAKIDTAVTIVLLGVLLSQIFGPVLIDRAVRNGTAKNAANPGSAPAEAT